MLSRANESHETLGAQERTSPTEEGVVSARVELPRTGHDIHFLSRLERVGYGEADLALRLYRDRALVRALLAERVIPEAAERVGIPLGEGSEAPHVVVARDGGFVTCLGPAMATQDLPIIPFDRLYVHLNRSDELRQKLARAGEVLEDQKASGMLCRRLYSAGLGLTREEFQQLAAIAPMLLDELNDSMIDLHKQMLAVLAPQMARIKRPHAEVERLRLFWNTAHTIGHLMLLTSLGGRCDMERWAIMLGEFSAFEELYLRIVWVGDGPIALKALWALGRAGKAALPLLKQTLNRSQTLPSWGTRVLGLLAIGSRHRRLHAEVEGALSPTRLSPPLRDHAETSVWARCFQAAYNMVPLLETASSPEVRERRMRIMAGMAIEIAEPNEQRWMNDALAPTRLATTPFNFIDHAPGRGFARMGMAVCALASLPAERFYLPEADRALAPQFSIESAMAMAQFARPDDPVRVAPKPGRNDPCSCGSSKKYKKCCGA